MTYLSFETPSQGLRIIEYLLVFEKTSSNQGLFVCLFFSKKKENALNQFSLDLNYLPRTLILTETAIYLLDEDYSYWPVLSFVSGYNYVQRPPYRIISQHLIRDIVCLVFLSFYLFIFLSFYFFQSQNKL